MLRTILFDFNGVIIDDEDYHCQALKRVLSEEGVAITDEAYYRDCLGFNDAELFRWGLKDAERIQNAGGLPALIERKSNYYEALLHEQAPFFPGVLAFINALGQKYPLGVASMALRREIEMTLKKGNLSAMFSIIVSGEEVEKTKPHPEAYQKALTRMNLKLGKEAEERILPAECLVIEDSRAGVRAGKAAGMQVLALPHTTEEARLQEADWIVPSFEGLSVAYLEDLFDKKK